VRHFLSVGQAIVVKINPDEPWQPGAAHLGALQLKRAFEA